MVNTKKINGYASYKIAALTANQKTLARLGFPRSITLINTDLLQKTSYL